MIVVLGAFGKTGKVVAARLESDGRSPVRRVTRNPARRTEAGREIALARLSDDAELGAALKGTRALYAILPDDPSAECFHAERHAMAEAMARAVRREGVRRVVLLSSVAAALGQDGHNGFGADLAYFERVMLDTPAQVTILRASYFQDNLTETLGIAARDGFYPNFFGSSAGAIATIAALDVGTFAARSLLEPPDKEREIVDLLGPSYSSTELAAIVGELVGRRLSVLDVPKSRQEELFQQSMSREAARAMAQTFECIGSGRASPQGDRTLHGTTRVEEVLRSALASSPSHASRMQP